MTTAKRPRFRIVRIVRIGRASFELIDRANKRTHGNYRSEAAAEAAIASVRVGLARPDLYKTPQRQRLANARWGWA